MNIVGDEKNTVLAEKHLRCVSDNVILPVGSQIRIKISRTKLHLPGELAKEHRMQLQTRLPGNSLHLCEMGCDIWNAFISRRQKTDG